MKRTHLLVFSGDFEDAQRRIQACEDEGYEVVSVSVDWWRGHIGGTFCVAFRGQANEEHR